MLPQESNKIAGKAFTSPSCPNCPLAKEKIRRYFDHQGWGLEEYDISTIDGEAEAMVYGIMGVPALLLFVGDSKSPHLFPSSFFEKWDGKTSLLEG